MRAVVKLILSSRNPLIREIPMLPMLSCWSTFLCTTASVRRMPMFLLFTYWSAFLCTKATASFVFKSPSFKFLPNTPSSSLLKGTSASDEIPSIDMDDVGFVLLAGGKGSRMKADKPKQFLELAGVPILHHSLDLFLERLPAALRTAKAAPSTYVVLVMDPMYQPEYQPIVDKYAGRLAFANPGVERQGSVENGLKKLVEVSGGAAKYAAIHDSARPLVTINEICDVVRDAKEVGAAVLGVPCKATIKESADGETVLRTIPRSRLWEVHTPQVVNIQTLLKGFEKVAEENLEVTDDVSVVEALGEPVKITLGFYTNLKITTPEDMNVATAILKERGSVPCNMLSNASM